MPAPPGEATVAEFAERARGYIKRAVGMDVEYDDISLAAANHYISTAQAVSTEGLREPIFTLLVSTLGAFFGEVVRHKLGGTWEAIQGPPEGWQMSVGPLHFSPLGVVAEAVHGGDAEGYDGSVHSTLGVRADLERLLESATPVTTEYFYSLTGKFETLVRMLDYLVARKAEGDLPPQLDEDGDPIDDA